MFEIIYGIIAMLSWSIADIVIAKTVRKASALSVVLWSHVFGLLIFSSVYLIAFGLPSVTPGMVLLMAFTGFLSFIAYYCLYKGLQVGKASVVSPIVGASGLVVFLIGVTVLGEDLTMPQTAAVLMIISGTVLASFRAKDLKRLRNPMKGVGYAVITMLAFGIYMVFLDIGVGSTDWFLPALMMKMFAIPFFLVFGIAAKKSIRVDAGLLPAVVLIGLLEFIGFIIFGYGLHVMKVSIIAPVASAFPLGTVILAAFFLRERLELNQYMGIAMIIPSIVVLAI